MSIKYRNIYFDDPGPYFRGLFAYPGQESGNYYSAFTTAELAAKARGHRLPGDCSPICGTFRRVQMEINGVPFTPPVGGTKRYVIRYPWGDAHEFFAAPGQGLTSLDDAYRYTAAELELHKHWRDGSEKVIEVHAAYDRFEPTEDCT